MIALLINNCWMRLSMISWIIKTEVCVICRSRMLRQITQTQGFDNSWLHAKTEFNNCFIIHFHKIHPQKQKRSVQPFCFWGEHSKGLSNQADVERNICSRYCLYVKFTSYWELIECSRPIRLFIVSVRYNNDI